MRLEVHSAADFLMNLLRVKQKQRNSLSESQLQNFKGSLADVLMRRYHSHWYPELPHKGSGFRCIRINGRLDPLIEQASSACGLPLRAVKKMLPHELTMWIDPDEVSYRIGENGSICVLYDISHHRASPASDLDSTASSNGAGVDEFVTVRTADHIAMVSGDLMEEFFENSSARIVTKPKVRQNSYHHQQQQHRNNASFNNSISSTSSGQLSPPLSPPFNHNHQQQQQQHHHQNQFHQSQQFRHQQQHHQQQQQHRYQPHPTMHQNQPQQPFNNHQFNNNYNNFMNDAVAPTTTQQQFYQWENSAFHSHHGNNNKGLLQAVR